MFKHQLPLQFGSCWYGVTLTEFVIVVNVASGHLGGGGYRFDQMLIVYAVLFQLVLFKLWFSSSLFWASGK